MDDATDASGPATLWGILRSDHSKNEGKEREQAGEDVANLSQTSGLGLAVYRIVHEWRIAQALRETEDSGFYEWQEPANTPCNERDQDGPNGINGPAGLDEKKGGTQYSSPCASSPFHTEKFDFIPPMIRPPELTKTQKRKLEKKRAALKRKEAAELKRRRGDGKSEGF